MCTLGHVHSHFGVSWRAHDRGTTVVLDVVTNPKASTALFTCVYSDHVFVKITFGAAAAIALMIAFAVKALAANATSRSAKLYRQLASCQAPPFRLSVQQSLLIHALIQDHDSRNDPLSAYTWSGDKHTMSSVLTYAAETLIYFTLLVTFSNFLKIR